MILPSWSNLEYLCPIEIKEITKFGKNVATTLNQTIEMDKINEYKQKLIMASAELETMILNFVALLSNIDELCVTDIDKGLMAFMKDDLARFLSFIDEKQNQLLEIPDGEPSSGIGRTTAFKKVLKIALDLIYYSLWEASNEYNKIEEEKRLNMFLRILFLVISLKLSATGGAPRKSGSFMKKTMFPSSWRSMFTKEGAERLQEGINKEYGEKPGITDDDTIFENLMEDEDGDKTDIDELDG